MSTPLAASLFLLLTGAAAVLAVAETSLTHLGRARASALEEDGEPRAPTLHSLLRRREHALNPVLFTVVTCHLCAATIVAIWADARYGTAGVVAAVAGEVIVIFVLAEAVPKTYALTNPDEAALRITPVASFLAGIPPLRWFLRLLVGVSNVILPGSGSRRGPSVSEEELLALAGAAADAEVIEVEERALIESIIEFGDTIVREIMVPRPDMITVNDDFRVVDVMEVAILNGYSRLPVCGDGIDDIVGLVYAKDLMRAERDGHVEDPVGPFARPAWFVPESKRVAELLREMQAEQFHMAIVVDEYGGTAGIVTLEDVIEELVGEIVDEFDVEEAMIEPLGAGAYRVNARMPVDEVNDLTGADLPDGDWDTVGGLLYSQFGHVPVEGEAIELGGFRLTASRVQGRRIGRVRIEPLGDRPAVDGVAVGE